MKEKLYQEIKKYEKDVVKFLRDIIACPSESCQEKQVVERIAEEMRKVGFDEVKIDPMGNVLGRIGNGKTVIAMDAHIDCVGVGDPAQWKWDPFKGKEEDGKVYGRGTVDQKSGMVGMVYGVKLIKELGLLADYTLWVVGSVQEEDCDGLCWQYIVKEDKLVPECVVITEPTNMNIYRGHRGRMEIGITAKGKACHGSAPHRGVNAVYKMAKIINEIEKLNERLIDEEFLGKGTVTVSYIDCKTPSLCAVPDEAYIHLDRRLTKGETKESAMAEVADAIKRAGVEAEAKVLMYEVPSYTGLIYPTEKYYPTWVLEEGHPLYNAAVKTYEVSLEKKPFVDKWTFSTNGIATMGMFGIPTIGFGPADETYAHSVDEFVSIEELLHACLWYAMFPKIYTENK